MESLGVFAEADQWECFTRLFSNEDQEFNEGAFPFQNNEVFNYENQAILYPNPEDGDQMDLSHLTMFNQSLYHSLDTVNSNMHYVSQENSSDYSDSNNEIFTTPILNPESYYFDGNSCYNMSTFVDGNVDGNVESFIPTFRDTDNVCNNGEMAMSDESQPPEEMQLKRVHEETSNTEDASECNPKKKPRLSKDKAKKSNARQKKGHKANSNAKGKNEDENSATVVDRSSSSYDNSDDDIASHETNGEVSDPKSSSALNLNGKTRANRGSATDPQSLYARKRRERINERLRVLQNLVPNGTKVDISTMLEEAVHYVKFLQLQIKLLSSDDMWMYSPIAYNGMDIGLDLHKMCPPVL